MGKKEDDKPSSILLVDDEPITRLGLQQLIKKTKGLKLIAEATDTADGWREVDRKRPDVAILDIAIEGDRGMEFIERVHDRTRVLVFSLREESIYAKRCLNAGAKGYISKREATDKVEKAIRTILDDKVYLSERISQRLFKQMMNGGADPVEVGAVDVLTDRELEVFELLGEGATTNQIAKQLSLSPKTVQSYHANIKKSLSLSNNNQLIRRAVHYVLQGR